jgi:hypothetical protein
VGTGYAVASWLSQDHLAVTARMFGCVSLSLCFLSPNTINPTSTKQLLIATQDPRTNHQTWYLGHSLENFSGSSRLTCLQRHNSTLRNRRPCSSQSSSNATQRGPGRGSGSTSNLVDLRWLTLDSFSVLLAGFLTEGNGSSLTEAEPVHTQTLRPVSWSREGTV